MSDLVFNYKDTAYTDSLCIADGGGIEHRAILQLIKNHLEDLQDFGRIAFEMRPLNLKGGPNETINSNG